MRRLLAGLCAVLGLVLVLTGCTGEEKREVKTLPEVSLVGFDSVDEVDLSTLEGPLVVNLWASWCGPCRQEHPLLMDLAKDPSIRVVGINYKDAPENALRFLGTFGNPYAAVGVDPAGRAAIDWGVYGVPESFIVGPDGTIRHKQIGPLTPGQLARFRAELRKAKTPG